MYAPESADEATTITGYLGQQLEAIRAASYGLSEEQATATPCRSALSIAGLIKHTAYGVSGAVARLRGEEPAADIAAYLRTFALTDGETTAGMLEEFDRQVSALMEELATTDPDAEASEPAAPWHGRFAPTPIRQRYLLVHMIEEIARHAGHADIIREELDGESIATLVMSLQGVPANDFFTPYQPGPGTIGAPAS